VFGAEAAARTWFHHGAQSLTPAEAVRLAVALPNPISRAPTVRDAELTRKCVRLIRLLRMQGLLDSAQERVALDEVGAPGEHVLPDRGTGAPPPPSPPSPAGAPPPAEPPEATEAPPGEAPPPPADEPPPTGEPPHGEPPPVPPAPAEPSAARADPSPP
jgi:hypothetical protein